jgi:hypothetical protein
MVPSNFERFWNPVAHARATLNFLFNFHLHTYKHIKSYDNCDKLKGTSIVLSHARQKAERQNY